MNRPGQPQAQPQRLPNLPPAVPSNINAPMAFRSPYSYGAVPPRAMPPPPPPGSAYAQNQNRQPQPSPGFVTPRGIGGAFPFGVTTASLQQQQQQSNSVQQQQQQQPTAQSQSNIQQPPQSQLSSQQHQTPGSSQLQPPPGILPAPSASSTSEILDPNEFPALGSTAPSQPNSAQPNNLHTSYASQAGQQPQPSAPSNLGAPGGGARDFRPEDFPALGQVQTQQQQGDGLNGFQSQSQEHRANLLSGLSGNAGQRPAPSLEERLQAEKRVRNFIATRAPARLSPLPQLNPPNQNHLSWPQQQQQQPLSQQQQPSQQPQNPAATSANHPQAFSSGPNPNPSQTLSNGIAAAQQQSQPQQQQPLGPPPGVPPPNNPFPNPPSAPQYVARPAQQVLVSPADRWGLLGLLAMIKSSDPDLSVLTVGTDLGTMGLDMNQAGNLYSTFITPWSDSSAAHTVEPDFHLPACYNVQPPQPNPAKAASFSDETLFFMFYSSPRDLLQEIAAQELYNRNWRYHKNYRLWLTKETGTAASRKDAAHEEGLYTFFDPENWEKLKKDAVIQYDQLEERPALSGVGASIGVPNVGAPVVGIPQGVGATGVPRYGMQGL